MDLSRILSRLATKGATTIASSGTPDYIIKTNSSGTLDSSVLPATVAITGVSGNFTVAGDLTVNGTTTTINSTILSVDDINVVLGDIAVPTNITANGGGITLKGATDKTIVWDNTNSNWTSSENWNIPTSKVFKINNVSVLSATTLGASVTQSSLTRVGTLAGGGATGLGFTIDFGASTLSGQVPISNLDSRVFYQGNSPTITYNSTWYFTNTNRLEISSMDSAYHSGNGLAVRAGGLLNIENTGNIILAGTIRDIGGAAVPAYSLWSTYGTGLTAIANGTNGQVLTATTNNLASWSTLTKASVGLANVDNTSDAAKNAASAILTSKTINGASNTLTVRLASDVIGILGDASLSNNIPRLNQPNTFTHGLTVTAVNANGDGINFSGDAPINIGNTGPLNITGQSAFNIGTPANFQVPPLIIGISDGSDATTGNVGEYVANSVIQAAALTLTTATPKTVHLINLTAGDWNISAIGAITGTSTGTAFDVAISTATNSFTGSVLGHSHSQSPIVSTAGADATLAIPNLRVSINSPQTYYLIVQETFPSGTQKAYGRISAHRIR